MASKWVSKVLAGLLLLCSVSAPAAPRIIYGDKIKSSDGTLTWLFPSNTGTVTLGTTTGNISGNAGTASALASTPSQCSGSDVATGIAANGNANCSAVPSNGSSLVPTPLLPI